MHRQPGPRQQAAQLAGPFELARGIEAPVQDAVAGLKVREQSLEGLRRRPRLRGQVAGLRFLQVLPQALQAGRVLSHQKLGREVQGVERPGEGPQLRLVKLKPHHLAYAHLHPVQAHRAVLLQMGEHEAEGQRERRLGPGALGLLMRGLVGSGIQPFRLSKFQLQLDVLL